MARDSGTRREWGSGSITWTGPSTARLRVSVEIDGQRVRRTKTVHVSHRNHGGRGEAAEALREFVAECQSPTDQRSPTVDQLMADYIAHCERIGRTPTTLDSYRMVRTRLRPIGDVKVRDLTARHLDDLYGTLSKKLSANTIRHTHSVILAALKQGVAWGLVDTNVAARATPPARPRTNRDPLAVSDLALLVRAAEAPRENGGNGDPVLAVALILGAVLGLRRGELCGLQWGDVDWDTGTVRVERQWATKNSGVYLSEPKSAAGRRTAYLGADGLAVLSRYRSIWRAELGADPEGWLLSYDGGQTPIRPKALGGAIAAVGRRIGITVTTHSLRRVSATELVAAGVDVDTASRRLGHTKEVMLGHYVLGADDRAVAAAATLEARLAERGLGLGELLAD